jgi:hypothetical protein
MPIYTERNSKVGILTRRLLKNFCLERVIIAYGKARVKTKIWMQSRHSKKPIFESRSVYRHFASSFHQSLLYLSNFVSYFSFNHARR